jgi:hypothetical protein
MSFKKIFEHYKIIRNHPKNYGFFRKILVEIVYLTTVTNIKIRENLLKYSLYKKIKYTLKRGDIVLLGDLKTVVSLFVDAPFTHSAIYLGRNKFIHATGDGVSYTYLKKFFKEYDTIAIFGIPQYVTHRKKIINKAIKFAKDQFGKPYNYSLKKTEKKYFCTQLVNESFKYAGYETGLSTFYDEPKFRSRILKLINDQGDILQPALFFKSKFDLKYVSPNIKIENNFFSIVEK